MTASLAANVVGSWLTRPYSFSALIMHTFLEHLTTTSDIAAASITPAQYADVLQRGARGDFLAHPSLFPLFALLSVLSWSCTQGGDRPRRDNLMLHASIWIAVLAHFVAFPMLADRFFVAHYLSITVLAVALLSARGRRGGLAASALVLS